MPFFVSKPKRIEAVQFNNNHDLPPGVEWDDTEYDYVVVNKLHNSRIKIFQDDWVRVDNPNDRYPIDKDYMEQNYMLDGRQK